MSDAKSLLEEFAQLTVQATANAEKLQRLFDTVDVSNLTSHSSDVSATIAELERSDKLILKRRYAIVHEVICGEGSSADGGYVKNEDSASRPKLTRGTTVVAPAEEWARGEVGADAARVDSNAAESWQITDPKVVEVSDKVLGSGAFGIVFSGMYLGKEVAIKKLHIQSLDASEEKEFVYEAKLMASLRHPNLLLLLGACLVPGNMYMVTELMARGSVSSLLHPKKSQKKRALAESGHGASSSGRSRSDAGAGGANLSFKRRMLFAKGAAQGMNALHSMKPAILHRDFKTANLLVDENWVVKVADFGLALAKRRASGGEASAEPVGSPLYMAPEVLLGNDATAKSDVYSFGIGLWELATERHPWDHVSFRRADEIASKVCSEQARPPVGPSEPGAEGTSEFSTLPYLCPTLVDLIQKCWASLQDDRPDFESMLSSHVFDRIIIEQLISERSSGARRFWESEFFGQYAVPWTQFAEQFLSAAGMSAPGTLSPNSGDDDIRAEQTLACLRYVLQVEQTESEGKAYVTIERFGELLEWFGPWPDEVRGASKVVDRVLDLLRKTYFHGFMDQYQAKSTLATGGNVDKAKKKKGAFLIRFSASEPGCFTLGAVKQDRGIAHWRIVRQAENCYRVLHNDYASLDDVIKKVPLKVAKLDISKPVAAPTPFVKIFSRAYRSVQNEPSAVAYMDDSSGLSPPSF